VATVIEVPPCRAGTIIGIANHQHPKAYSGAMKVTEPEKSAATLIDRTLFATHKLGMLVLAKTEIAFSELGFTARDYFVLAGVDRPTPVSQQDLSRTLGIDPTTMVAIIDDLERRGLVERTRNTADRRRYDLTLTATGRADVKAANRVVDKTEREFLRVLETDERAAYRAAAAKLLRAHWR
jgi:MarR family transcriptional regulator, lower aerobic nicotinate degradation pathway regulator